jgi:hypothetical protein
MYMCPFLQLLYSQCKTLIQDCLYQTPEGTSYTHTHTVNLLLPCHYFQAFIPNYQGNQVIKLVCSKWPLHQHTGMQYVATVTTQ